MIRGHEIATFLFRDLISKAFPVIGKDLGGTVLIKPRELLPPRQEYPAKYQSHTPIRMIYPIRETQRAAPGPAKNVPFIDIEFLAERLDVLDQVPRRVLAKLRMRRRTTRPALDRKSTRLNSSH